MFHFLIAAVWIVNGLFCKVMNIVPRHHEIVGAILGHKHTGLYTMIIGCLETAMGLWILSNFLPRLNVILQVITIAAMNILEFILVPELLLWGRLNLFFAALFILFICFNEFYLRKQTVL